MIVSVSRRCDIPRFRFDWFMERLDEGFVTAVNPYNAGQKRLVPLIPSGTAPEAAREAGLKGEDGVDVFAFWTRDPRNILANAEELTQRGFCFYAMITVTGYPAALEPNMPKTGDILAAMKELAQKIGADRVIWRYDPVLLSTITDEDFHRENFDALARSLSGAVRRVIISRYTEYRGSRRRFERLENAGILRLTEPAGSLRELFTGMARSAGAAGMEIQSCAGTEDFSPFGIKPGACVDAGLIRKIRGLEITGKDKNQRPRCLCAKSVDIGAYGTCPAGCVYCYAN